MRQIKISKRLTVRDSKSFDLYLKDIDKYQLLSIAEEEELAIQAAKGDVKARNKLINSNLRFVVSIAKKYQWR